MINRTLLRPISWAMLVLVATFWLGACSSSVNQPVAPSQEFLFFAGYESYAWGYRALGFLVRANGDVLGYDNRKQNVDYVHEPSTDSAYAEEELLAGFPDSLEVIGSVETGELVHVSSYIAAAATGELSRLKMGRLDAGNSYFMAFTYTDSTATYHPVLLGMFGESERTNSAPEADSLWRWLVAVGDSMDIELPNPDDPWY